MITLAIIGVVAALTIPSVVLNYQKQETVARLKKTYSALSNTTNLAIAEYGPIKNWEFKSGGTGSVKFAEKYMIPYLKVIRNCKNSTTDECSHYRWNLGHNTKNVFGDGYAKFVLSDGTLILSTNHGKTGPSPADYVEVYVDLNGKKLPNALGKDMFVFEYGIDGTSYDGKFKPASGNTWICSKTSTGQWAGGACTDKIMKDGWQIKDDYPW